MKTNRLMENLLKQYQISIKMDPHILDASLKSILSKGIIEMDGCYFLQALLPDGFDIKRAMLSSIDRTGLESEVNHIHLNDSIKYPDGNGKYFLEQGIQYAFSLKASLPKSAKFKIILAYTLEPIIDCNIRFYKQRNDEEWLKEDLDNYNEAIFVIESGK
jgi:hypothetical protein